MNKPPPPAARTAPGVRKPRANRSDDPPAAASVSVDLPDGQAGNRTAPGDSARGDAPPDDGNDNLRLPHERDESISGATAAEPDPVMTQAARDLASGQVDTDMRATPGLDAERREHLTKRRP
ncbi:hypothetical protein [Hydrogenophaga pseudoflava]|uniref:hypothetical protein n=1 Tax=Hydrogenophaga pseudoflava TaxID=47421 RepID=UPI0027E524A1|nr:hypothetical protein [Hydrogenophaga pseudoflava]MDQ7744379.1 hypothetical protein [Hydrogenophaga pseudoflava]